MSSRSIKNIRNSGSSGAGSVKNSSLMPAGWAKQAALKNSVAVQPRKKGPAKVKGAVS